MADYIPREAAIDAIEGINWYKYNDEGRLVQGGTSHDKMFLPYKAVEGSLKAIPAADVRPVVLFRDCIHCRKGKASLECEKHTYAMHPILDWLKEEAKE